MAEQPRRTLVEGLNKTEADRAKEESFVFGTKAITPPTTSEPAPTAPPATEQRGTWRAGRVPVTIRMQPDLAERLKRLSLERRLAGQHPADIQDIVEEALQLWLVKNNLPL